MLQPKFNIAFILTLALQHARGELCSPSTCIKGTSHSGLAVHDKTLSRDYIPGYYPDLQLTKSDLTLGPNLTVSTDSSSGLTIYPPQRPVLFGSKNYAGGSEGGGSGAWESAYLPEGWYGLVAPGQAIWGAVPDRRQLLQASMGSVVSVAYANCDPPCGSSGTCTPAGDAANSTTGTCICAPGWAGQTCSTCAPGYYGPSCMACPENCTICDDGLAGTGSCLRTMTNSSEICNCLHGTCSPSGDCLCSAGWITNATVSDQKCNTCAKGFFQTANDDCLVCPLGCQECTSQSNGNGSASAAPTCTTCSTGLKLSSAIPATCISTQTCSTSQYWDNSTSSCQNCSPACTSCTGPSTSDCLACASPRANLNGACVGYDPTTGICESGLSGLNGAFVLNNAKARCEACPAGCASCIIPSFSPSAPYTSLECSSCQDGYLLQAGRCVKTCSGGYYLPPGAERNGTCQPCDKSCTSCINTSTTCTRCASNSTYAHDGNCIPTCPSNTIALNGTCTPCSPDCSTCSSPSSTSCLSCPPNRPVLQSRRCLDHCPKSAFLDSSTGSCTPCDPSCASCLGGGSSACTSCPDNMILQSGICKPANCDSTFATGLGVCLDSLLSASKKRFLGFIALPMILLISGLMGWWYVRRRRRQTREETKNFANALDDHQVKERMIKLRLETVLGLDRLRTDASSSSDRTEGKGKGGNGRLRQLLLAKPGNKRDVPMVAVGVKAKDKAEAEEAGDGWGRTESHWFVPPPPYVPSTASSSYSNGMSAYRDRQSFRQSTDTLYTLDLEAQVQGIARDLKSITGLPTPDTKFIDLGASRFNSEMNSDLGHTLMSGEGAMGSGEAGIVGLRPPPRQCLVREKVESHRETIRSQYGMGYGFSESGMGAPWSSMPTGSSAGAGDSHIHSSLLVNEPRLEGRADHGLEDLWPALGGRRDGGVEV